MLGGDKAPLVASVLSPLEMGNEPHFLGTHFGAPCSA